jgi:hypothetical protein
VDKEKTTTIFKFNHKIRREQKGEDGRKEQAFVRSLRHT